MRQAVAHSQVRDGPGRRKVDPGQQQQQQQQQQQKRTLKTRVAETEKKNCKKLKT